MFLNLWCVGCMEKDTRSSYHCPIEVIIRDISFDRSEDSLMDRFVVLSVLSLPWRVAFTVGSLPFGL